MSKENREQAFRRFILEHLLPAIAWRMCQAGRFYIKKKGREEGQLDLEKELKRSIEECLNEDFFDTFPFFNDNLEEENFRAKPRKLFNQAIKQVCCRDLLILITEGNNYRFLHQNFRDYFAARYVQNQIKIGLQKRELPKALRQAPLNFDIRLLLGELEGEHTNKMEWREIEKKWQWSKGEFSIENDLSQLLELCRGMFDEGQLGFTVWNILTIKREQAGELSGANLQQLDFVRFPLNGIRFSRPELAACISKSRLIEQNICNFSIYRIKPAVLTGLKQG
ncbi:MAG: hypothetical protein H6557_13115 [Lewinellaceae bacterium]|nr:hypothetical protein [Phaeodactylibacter sp.]MCB9037548.1 hypothetical protein [Lewinellaceae bacterium]